eukprot:8253359-Pyramimonas_sp.AAC.1
MDRGERRGPSVPRADRRAVRRGGRAPSRPAHGWKGAPAQSRDQRVQESDQVLVAAVLHAEVLVHNFAALGRDAEHLLAGDL